MSYWRALHGSKVDEWDYEQLNSVETCGDEIQEAKAYITDDMLMSDGLRKDNGIYHLAFSTIEKARKGMKECHAIHASKIRNAIMKCSGIDDETYKELIGTEEIVENTDKGGEFPPSAKLLSFDYGKMFLDTEFVWGSTGYNDEGAQNSDQHDLMTCCICIMTRVTCWIESLELVSCDWRSYNDK